jgi:hypothetical protein
MDLQLVKLHEPDSVILLQAIGMVEYRPVEQFKAVPFFKGVEKEGVKIDESFRERFMQGKGKVETGVPSAKHRACKVTNLAMSGVAACLREPFESYLAHLAQLITAHLSGSPGLLLTNGANNGLFALDQENTLCLCALSCVSDSLLLRASPAAESTEPWAPCLPHMWGSAVPGHRVFLPEKAATTQIPINRHSKM